MIATVFILPVIRVEPWDDPDFRAQQEREHAARKLPPFRGRPVLVVNNGERRP